MAEEDINMINLIKSKINIIENLENFIKYHVAGSRSWIWLPLLGAFLFTTGCATFKEREARFGSNIPIIAVSFAKDKIISGDTWKIYINAFDQDGDMEAFVCSIFQDGMQPYPFDTVWIKPDQKEKLSGYLYLPTSPFQDLWNIHIELYISIVDRAGHMSKEELFELRFSSEASDKDVDKTLFAERSLGPIKTDIMNPSIGDVSGGDFGIQ